MPNKLTEDLRRPGHYIVSEAAGYRSREQLVLAAGNGIIAAGSVLGKISASSEYAPLDPDATDGSESAVAVNYESKDTTDTAQRVTLTVRDTEVHEAVLTWPDGITTEQLKAAIAELNTVGIVGR